jgi:hypothetical protein
MRTTSTIITVDINDSVRRNGKYEYTLAVPGIETNKVQNKTQVSSNKARLAMFIYLCGAPVAASVLCWLRPPFPGHLKSRSLHRTNYRAVTETALQPCYMTSNTRWEE